MCLKKKKKKSLYKLFNREGKEGSETALMFNSVVLLQLLVLPGDDMLLHPFMSSQHKPTNQWAKSQMAAEKPIYLRRKQEFIKPLNH